MEGIQKAVRSALKEQNMGSSSSSYPQIQGPSVAISPPDQSPILVTRYPRQGVSALACSKLCTICFVVEALGVQTSQEIER